VLCVSRRGVCCGDSWGGDGAGPGGVVVWWGEGGGLGEGVWGGGDLGGGRVFRVVVFLVVG